MFHKIEEFQKNFRYFIIYNIILYFDRETFIFYIDDLY